MSKITLKASTMLNPVPVVMVSCGDMTDSNIVTVAWAGTICSDPPMVYISLRKERKSYEIIKNSGEFVINLVSASLTKHTDYCGVKSGRDIDKFSELNLTKEKSEVVAPPCIHESPVNIECRVRQVTELGSHDMFLAEVVNVHVDESIMDSNGKIDMAKADLICYSHGEYWNLKDSLGFYGYTLASDEILKRRLRKNK